MLRGLATLKSSKGAHHAKRSRFRHNGHGRVHADRRVTIHADDGTEVPEVTAVEVESKFDFHVPGLEDRPVQEVLEELISRLGEETLATAEHLLPQGGLGRAQSGVKARLHEAWHAPRARRRAVPRPFLVSLPHRRDGEPGASGRSSRASMGTNGHQRVGDRPGVGRRPPERRNPRLSRGPRMSPVPDSNRRPHPYHGCALPAELTGRGRSA
jgi:hypothetical protein